MRRGGAQLLVVLAVTACTATFVALYGRDAVTAMGDMMGQLGPWGLPFYVVAGAVALALFVPAAAVGMMTGALFGFPVGVLVASAIAVLGALLVFLIGRSGPRGLVERHCRRTPFLAQLDHAIGKDALRIGLLLRLSSVLPFAPVSYALALSRVRLREYLLSLPAMLPSILLFVYAGHVTREIVSGTDRGRSPWEIALLVAGLLAAAGAAALIGRAARRALAKARQADREGRPSLPLSTPPISTNARGEPRQVGVEIEMLDLDLETAADGVAAVFGGTVERQDDVVLLVRGTRHGDFKVEIDSQPLKDLAAKPELTTAERMKRSVLSRVAEMVTPVEVVTPPLPFDRVADLDRLVDALRARGAGGTRRSVFYVLGVHFNPEVPAADPGVLLRYLRAYVLLHGWLVSEGEMDMSRRIMRFARPYPASYVRRLLDPDYAPDLGTLIDDYVAENPSRDRALDMLPLFLHLDPDRVRSVVEDTRVKPRPTFHFRLPNSRVDEEEWRLTDEWRRWLAVERLAADEVRLMKLLREYRARLDRPFGIGRRSWRKRVGRLVERFP